MVDRIGYIRVIAVLFVLMIGQVSFAQTTWKGLRFGMSEADLRKEYTASLEKNLTENGEFKLTDKNQELYGSRATAEFYFDKDGKLSMIELFMKDPFAGMSTATGASLALVSDFPKRLVEKYGVPVSQEGDCEDWTAEIAVTSYQGKIFSCDKRWRSDGQTIKMYWAVHNPTISFFSISYEPLPSDI